MLENDLRTSRHSGGLEAHRDFLAAEASNPRACNATFLRGAFTALPEPATWSIRLRPASSRLRSTKLRRTGEREARAGLTEAVVQPREAKPNVVR